MLRILSLLLFACTLASLTVAAAPPKRKRPTPRHHAVHATHVARPAPTPDLPLTPQYSWWGPETNAISEIVIDANSGSILHEKNADELRAPASTQKLLTALLIVEAGNLEKPIVVQPVDTFVEPSKLGFKPGEVYTRRELLNVLLVHSANDAARALARDHAGSVESFAWRMNAKAAALGMRRSCFQNPNGLPAPGQYSNARDLARLARAAYRSPTLRRIFSQKVLFFRRADGRVLEYKNTNQVLRRYPYCNGMKTGYTVEAKHCLISSGAYNGREVICVMLGNDKRVWQDSCTLLGWGFTRARVAADAYGGAGAAPAPIGRAPQ